MCIRDRLYRLKEIFLKERDPETPVGFVRQAGRKGIPLCGGNIGVSHHLGYALDGYAPVSYTHLDVYKRQLRKEL